MPNKFFKTIASLAPMLGAVLPIPGGAAIGQLIASTFGGDSNNPDELTRLIQADPDAALKLKEIESNNKVALEKLLIKKVEYELLAETTRLETVNATMRVESMSDRWWVSGWRPFIGFITGLTFMMQMAVIFYAVIKVPLSAAAIVTSMTSLSVFWGVPLAILGVSAYHRGKEKRVKAGEDIKPLFNMFNK